MTFAASLKHIPVRLDTTLQRKRESEHTSLYRLFFLPCILKLRRDQITLLDENDYM